MLEVPMQQKIEWLMAWDAKCKVRVNYCQFDQSYEILFKHEGTDRWHEYILTDYQLRHNTVHDALQPLRTLVKMTAP